MRELKFRMWIIHWQTPQLSQMIYEINQVMECLKNDMLFNVGKNWECPTDFLDGDLFMLYTGFKDINNKEIYEHDIIGDWTDVDGKQVQSRQTVYFDEMLGQWMLDFSLKQDRSASSSLFDELKEFQYEVIGNIYENPELLKSIV